MYSIGAMPRKIPESRFQDLIELMVDADIAGLRDQMSGKVTRYSHEGV